ILHFDCNWAFGDDAVAALAALPHRLRHLGLDFSGVTAKTALALSRSRAMETLESLDVSASDVGEAGFVALVEAARRLRVFHIGGLHEPQQATPAVALALVTSAPDLEWLSL